MKKFVEDKKFYNFTTPAQNNIGCILYLLLLLWVFLYSYNKELISEDREMILKG